MTISAKIIEDSVSDAGVRLTTLQLQFHRFILPEFNTHRVFSRNFSSSRAVPTEKLIEQVRTNPAMPVHWGRNQPGMQAQEELQGVAREEAQAAWRIASMRAAKDAETLRMLGAHKQIINRVLEPYLYVSGVVTATEWGNFFSLRAHPDAQPEIHALALAMQAAMQGSTPKPLRAGEWHLPYVSAAEREVFPLEQLQQFSAARCARVSYLLHDGTQPNPDKDRELFQRLVGSTPLHASPIEHQAAPDRCGDEGGWERRHLHGNLVGWVQYRKLFEGALV